jgi:hypothetical protein
MLNIVAIDDEKGRWIRATGENRTKSGWIERVATRKTQEDIVTAVLLNKALRGKEKTMNHAEMEKIVTSLPFPNNYFAVKMLQRYPAPVIDNNPEVTESPSVSDDEEEDDDTESSN